MTFPSQLRRAKSYCDLRALAPPTAPADDYNPTRINARGATRPEPRQRHAMSNHENDESAVPIGNGENYPSLPPKNCRQGPEFGRLSIGVGGEAKDKSRSDPYVYAHDRNAPSRAHEAPPATKSAGRRSSAAIRRSTASSCSPSAPPESIAGRAAPPGRPSARTSHSSRPSRKPRKRATAPANAAGPTSLARPIHTCRRSSARANGSRPPRRRRSLPSSRRARA